MPFNPVKAKQAQEVIFSTNTNKSTHPPFYFNNATVKRKHLQKHLRLQLDNKLSLSEHTNNKIKKAAKAVGLLRKLQPILPRITPILLFDLILIMEMLFSTNRSTHHFQLKSDRCIIMGH